MSFYKAKRVLVTGGTGLIGRPLVEMLLAAGAEVSVVSLDDPSRAPAGATFTQADLRHFDACMAACESVDVVFHLAGVKGSPAMAARRPASFMVPTITFSFNMMEAARRSGVDRYLFTSSIGVYQPAEVLREDDVWRTTPSPHDRFAGWAKRICELQAEAYRIEYDWNRVCIVRPANVYGPYDNFDADNAMVVPSLIRRAMSGENPLVVWGDGTNVRDFIHARDVARGMMLVMEQGHPDPVNLGSGTGTTIREVAEIVAAAVPGGVDLAWDPSKPGGDQRRVMDVRRAASLGFAARETIADGIRETVAWYASHHPRADQRYNAFADPALAPAD